MGIQHIRLCVALLLNFIVCYFECPEELLQFVAQSINMETDRALAINPNPSRDVTVIGQAGQECFFEKKYGRKYVPTLS
ncbi:hypothetical protein L596_029469 [Steinernema carpocapsae]|uniref:Uncharacterized protein n=1 Tax=Steinernema carpocapsae TaxID=34508 RepID=A0A4U5LUQ6_STECR|nr:hypothetical protein L596_029469 [Steinernema carpocapsae]